MGWTVELVERPRKKPAPEKVLEAWAAEWAKEGEKVEWAKALGAARVAGVTSSVGGGAFFGLDLPQP